jgi:hypothetical protein
MDTMVVRVIRNGVKFPYHGYCLVDPKGDPYVMHLKGEPESCWPHAETMLRKPRGVYRVCTGTRFHPTPSEGRSAIHNLTPFRVSDVLGWYGDRGS